MPCGTGLPGLCSAGTVMCQFGALTCRQNLSAQPELCDGLDNNCNGAVDEGNPGGGSACITGLMGACSEGTRFCMGGALVCEPHNYAQPEICGDGLDNDCNGAVDNGCP